MMPGSPDRSRKQRLGSLDATNATDTPVTKNWTPLALGYLALSLAGLVGTWTFNILAVVQVRDFVGDWVGSGPAVSSLTVDLLVAAVAGSVFIITEARRLGMRRGWLYVVASGVTAFAFTFPLFLAMRERALAATRARDVTAASKD